MKNTLSTMLSKVVSRHWLPLSFACLLAFGCGSVQQPVSMAPPVGEPVNPAVEEINRSLNLLAQQSSTAPSDYQLGPEDFLKITLYNVPPGESITPRETVVRVSQEGKINLPLVGDLSVAKLSTFELERLLRERYEKYLRNPQIGVQIVEHRSQQVSVLGAVQKPGVLQLTGPRTLVDVLAMAGGISPKAGNQVHVISRGPEGRQSEVIDLFALATNPAMLNRPLQGGDVVNVPEAGTFFVDGAVGRPGSYPLTHTYTLTQAIAVAGGLDAVLSDNSGILLFRRRDHLNFDRIPVDLNAIRNREAPDPKIEPDDVIVVPIHTGKYIVERFLGRVGLPRVPSY
jgi:polysaccharide export outer membrane protein